LFTAQQGAYTDLGLTGIEVKNLIDKLLGSGIYTKLRARVKYDPVTAITGQVYGPWRNVSAIIDGNSLGALPIELISFNAAWLQKGKTAKINFTTDKEMGTCCFDIMMVLIFIPSAVCRQEMFRAYNHILLLTTMPLTKNNSTV
jgi:hypothetical protein